MCGRPKGREGHLIPMDDAGTGSAGANRNIGWAVACCCPIWEREGGLAGSRGADTAILVQTVLKRLGQRVLGRQVLERLHTQACAHETYCWQICMADLQLGSGVIAKQPAGKAGG